MSNGEPRFRPDRLKERRTALGWSQDKLGKILGYANYTLISFWEGGKRVPDRDTIRKLARALNTSVAYLTGDSDDPRVAVDAKGQSMPSILPYRLSQLRRARGLTTEQVAERIGARVSTVNAWEIGSHRPSIDVLVKFAQLYEVAADYLLGLTDDPFRARDSGLPECVMEVLYSPEFLKAVQDPGVRDLVTQPHSALLLRVIAATVEYKDMDPDTLEIVAKIIRAAKVVTDQTLGYHGSLE